MRRTGQAPTVPLLSEICIVGHEYLWDPNADVFVGSCLLIWRNRGRHREHKVASQGTTMAEAREALDGAVTLAVRNLPVSRLQP